MINCLNSALAEQQGQKVSANVQRKILCSFPY